MASTQVPATPDTIRLATRCIAAIGNYLDEFHLWPARPGPCACSACTANPPTPAARTPPPPARFVLPRSDPAPGFLAAAEGGDDPKRSRAARPLRTGPAQWFRNAGRHRRPAGDARTVAGIESLQAVPGVPRFWAAATASSTPRPGALCPPMPPPSACAAGIDAQMRRVMEGSSIVAERLMRDVLYHVATTSAHLPAIDSIRGTYQLRAGPDPRRRPADPRHAHRPDPAQAARSTLRCPRSLGPVLQGGAIGLPRFQGHHRPIIDQARTVGPARKSLTSPPPLGEFCCPLAAPGPLRLTDALSMDVATAMLLLDTRLDAHARADNREDVQIDAIPERLCPSAWREAPPLMAISEPDAQARQVNRQPPTRSPPPLQRSRDEPDGFFRSPGNTDIPATVRAPLKQVEGALLGDERRRRRAPVQDAAARIAALPAEAGDNIARLRRDAHRPSAPAFMIGFPPARPRRSRPHPAPRRCA